MAGPLSSSFDWGFAFSLLCYTHEVAADKQARAFPLTQGGLLCART